MTIELPKHHQKQSDENLTRINAIKQAEANLLQLVEGDGREAALACTNIEQGVMWAIRGIAKPKDIQPENVKIKNDSYCGGTTGAIEEGFKLQNSVYSGYQAKRMVLVLPKNRNDENVVSIARGSEVFKFSEIPARALTSFDIYSHMDITPEQLQKVPGNIVAVEVLSVNGRACKQPTVVKHNITQMSEHKVPGLHFELHLATGTLGIIKSDYQTFSIALTVIEDE